MYTLGVTGGIGSGKTTVVRIFQSLGIAAYDADLNARRLMEDNEDLRNAIQLTFGNEAYTANRLNRTWLAAQVFSDASALKALNALVHPAVGIDFNQWLTIQSGPYVIKEAALLFEAGSYAQLDATVLVSCPEVIRLQRVLKRDAHRNEAQVKAIFAQQWSEDRKRSLANHEMVNDGLKALIPQVLALHRSLVAQRSASID